MSPTTMSIACERALLETLTRHAHRISLHSGPPGTRGLNEFTDAFYHRQSVEWDAQGHNTNTIEFTVDGGEVTHLGFWERDVFQFANDTEPRRLDAGDRYRIAPGQLSLVGLAV